MNHVNMFNMSYSLPSNLDEYKKKQQEMETEYSHNVRLVSDFAEVRVSMVILLNSLLKRMILWNYSDLN